MRAPALALFALAASVLAANCPANSYSISSASCAACPSGATSPINSQSSAACVCPANSKLNYRGTACTCNDSTAIPITSSSTGALLCSPGCPAGQGLNMQTGACSTCPAGSASNGKTDCTACATGRYAFAGSSACTSCPYQSSSVTDRSTCSCSQPGRYFGDINNGNGYTCNTSCPGGSAGANGVCTLCSSGSVSSGAAGSSCMQCAANTYANPAATSCTACPAFSTSSQGSTTCSCIDGYASSGSGSTLVCTLNASGGAQIGKRKHRKRKYSLAELVFRVDADNSHLCPASTTACPLGKQGGFECLNLKEELHACGSCGNDCTKMPGVRSTRCEQGICVVSACKTGFTHFADANVGSACRRA